MKSLKQTEVVCRDVVEVVTDYLEDAMTPPERAAFEQHLHACPWCLTYLNQIRRTRASVSGLAAGDLAALPPAIEASLRAAFQRRHRG